MMAFYDGTATNSVKTKLQTIEPEKKGWLFKWTNYLKGYQKRYFVLSDGKLSYYRNPLEISQSCRGSICLDTAVIHSDDTFNFYIMGPVSTYHLKAASESEREHWVSALELAKVRAIRKIDADEDDMIEMSHDKDEMHTILKELQNKLEQMEQYRDKIVNHAAQMQRSLAELEATSNTEEAIKKLIVLNERATVFRVTTNALVSANKDYFTFCKNNCKKWQKLMEHEHDSRIKLEVLVEQLATQHSNLEQRAIKQQQQQQQQNSASADSIEEDEFYDAEEMPMATEFVITFPGKAHRVSSVSLVSQGTSRQDDQSDGGGGGGHKTPPPGNQDTSSNATETASKTKKKRNRKRSKSNSLNDSSNSNDEGEEEEEDDDNDYSSQETIQVDVVTRKSIGSTGKANDMSVTAATTPSSDAPSTAMGVVNGIPKRSARARRTLIPARPNHSLNLWSFMKNCIGKELTKIPMPVNFNEPLSMLQRMTEEFEYASLLHKAAKCTDPLEQMVYVAAFSITCYATTADRTNKPFNPLLGETYECDRTDDLGWRCISEQVSHHPPMLAQHCEADDWICWREFTMTSKFRGKYLSVTPIDITHLEFQNSKHHYTWRKVTTTVHNIIVGKLWVDNHGEMKIVNHHTGDVCHLNLHPYSYFSRDVLRKVNGVIVDKNGVEKTNIKWVLQGTWDNKIEAAKVINSTMAKNSQKPTVETATPKLIWKRTMPPREFEKIYNMTMLAVQLNEPEEGVAPTDSRLRPDQRLMEETRWDEANQLKLKLEDKQRLVRRQREEEAERAAAEGKPYVAYEPIWFKRNKDPITGNPVHIYTQDYWKCKQTQDWSRCPNIFLDDTD